MAIEQLMVAAPLVTTEVGQEFDSIPPHVEIVPWFDMDDSHWPKFDKAMRRVINETMQLTIQGGDIELPLEAEVANVTRMTNRTGREFILVNGETVHTGILNAIRCYGDYDPGAVSSKWPPSTGKTGAYELSDGEAVILPDLTIFRKRSASAMGKHVVRAVYSWENALHEQAAARS